MSDDLVMRVKEASPLEDVIQGDGFPLRRSGRYWTGTREDCNSLVVDELKQMFVWNSKVSDGWAGDVIRWVEKHRGLSFRGAVEWLGERAKIPVKWGHVDEGTLRLMRAREDAFEVACRVWGGWLWKDSGKSTVDSEQLAVDSEQSALGYARGRGWSDETIRLAGLGFTGRRSEAEYKEMRGEFSLHGIELDSPAAVSVLGFKGDVRAWGAKWGIDVDGERWAEWGFIPGAMGRMRLVYPHWVGGRVRYFSCRTILEDREFEAVNSDQLPVNSKRKEIKGKWNPYERLAGVKQLFFNQVYRRDCEELVVVEGPADAISLGQVGVPAVALCGLAAREGVVEGLRKQGDAGRQGKTTFYVALDQDGPGRGNVLKLAKRLGPMCRVVDFG